MKKNIILLCLAMSCWCVSIIAQPTITSFSPTSGPVGTTVTITGTNFNTTLTNNVVFFGATQANVYSATTTQLTVIVPYGATFQNISVTDTTTHLTGFSSNPFIVTFSCGGEIDTNSFAPKIDLNVGMWSQDIAIGDLDGDGMSDIVSVNYVDTTISILENNTSSNTISFLPKIDIHTNMFPTDVAIGDINGDGKLDIVVMNADYNGISIFKNTSTIGNISFAIKMDFTTEFNSMTIKLEDIDNDGKLDVVLSKLVESKISILKNTSNGGSISFAPYIDLNTNGMSPIGLSIGDLDNDSLKDIVVIYNGAYVFSVFKNTSISGVISFAAKVDFPIVQSYTDISIIDLDNDGMNDIVFAGSNIISVCKNISNSGIFSFESNIDYSVLGAYGISINDIDGDSKPDIITCNNSWSTISIIKNNSSVGLISFLNAIYFSPVGFYAPTNVKICDLNNDSKPEIITSTTDAYVSIFKNLVFIGPQLENNTSVDVCNNDTINIQLISNIPSTYTWIAIDNPNITGESISTQTTNTINNILINNTSSVQTVYYTVTPTSLNGSCIGTTQTIAVTVMPTPVMTNSSSATICSGNVLNISLTSNVPCNYNWLSDDNPNTTGESTTSQSSIILNDVITNNTIVPQALNYTITPTSTTGNCIGTTQNLTMTINPLPVVTFTGLGATYCYNATTANLIGNPTGGTFSGAGISGNIFTPSIANIGLHTITYSYTDGNNCSDNSVQTTEVLSLPVAPSICMVTVDTSSTNNIIYWDKTIYTNVDSFIVFRETSSNTFKRIGAVSMQSLSIFIDTTRNLYFPFTGNPNMGTYRYKLQIRDTCGNYSGLSMYHNTIYATQTGSTFNWNDYKIEGETIPIPELTAYYLWRDNNSTGNWTIVGGVSGSQLTINDPDYSSFPNARWRIETQWSINCDPTKSINSSRSNIKGHSVGIFDLNASSLTISIYPNPFTSQTIVTFTKEIKNANIYITDLVGKIVKTINISGKRAIIEKGTISSGIYFLQVVSENEIIATDKIVIE